MEAEYYNHERDGSMRYEHTLTAREAVRLGKDGTSYDYGVRTVLSQHLDGACMPRATRGIREPRLPANDQRDRCLFASCAEGSALNTHIHFTPPPQPTSGC
jgi:hypothetical protein